MPKFKYWVWILITLFSMYLFADGLIRKPKKTKRTRVKKKLKSSPIIDPLIGNLKKSNDELLDLLKSKEKGYIYYNAKSSVKMGQLVKVRLLNPIESSIPNPFAVFEVLDKQELPNGSRVYCDLNTTDSRVYFDCNQFQFHNEVKKISALVLDRHGLSGVKAKHKSNPVNRALTSFGKVVSSILDRTSIKVKENDLVSDTELSNEFTNTIKDLPPPLTLRAGGEYYLYFKKEFRL